MSDGDGAGVGAEIEVGGGQGGEFHAVVNDDEGVFVAAEVGAAVFDDEEEPGGDAFLDPLLEVDHAVGYIVEEFVVSDGVAVLVHFGGEDGGYAEFGEPIVEGVKFVLLAIGVAVDAQEHVEGIEGQALGLHPPGLAVEDGEESGEAEVSGINGLPGQAGLENEELAGALERGQVPAQGGGVLPHHVRALLEGHENPRLAPQRAAVEELEGQHALARSGTAAQ